MVIRGRERVRLLTKGGLDWADRYPWIVETARKLKQGQFVTRCRTSPRRHDHEVQFYAFDMLAGRATTTAACDCARPTCLGYCPAGSMAST